MHIPVYGILPQSGLIWLRKEMTWSLTLYGMVGDRLSRDATGALPCNRYCVSTSQSSEIVLPPLGYRVGEISYYL
jgi:hypothetical protein